MHVRTLVDDLLARHGLTRSRRGRLGGAPRRSADPGRGGGASWLTADALAASRAMLSAYGNCSSPTVLLILDGSARQPRPAASGSSLLAFGPGLTLYATLLEHTA